MALINFQDSEEFGNFLARAQEKTGKTFTELAQIIGCQSMRSWHNYRTFPTEEKLPLVAKAYEVELEELIRIFRASKRARREEWRCRRGKPRKAYRINLSKAASFDLPSAGPVNGHAHSFRNSGGR